LRAVQAVLTDSGRRLSRSPASSLAALLGALIAGSAHAFSFAPWNLPWLQVLALGALFALTARAPRWPHAAALGISFGLGWFGVGVSWVYISMHVYGQMPAPLAAAATAGFVAFLALYPAIALTVAHRIGSARLRVALALPATWALSDWLRGTLFTGFPWLATGYAHTDGPLAGFAPVLGVYGVGGVAALCAGALALLSLPRQQREIRNLGWIAAVFTFALSGGIVLATLRWTVPNGPPISVKLVQASLPQDEKFSARGLIRAFEEPWALMQGVRADLVVLPESVFPVPLQLVPERFVSSFRSYADARKSALVLGVFIEKPQNAYYNSAVGLAPGSDEWQSYSKRQLVPFGEFIPPGFRWFVDWMQMPIGDQQRGPSWQAPFALAGQRIAVNICYEDLFGEVIRAAWGDPQDAPSMMLNLSNLAWFRESIALPQHLQISRMRALETQHPMLRATNTGATAIIDHEGRVRAELPFNANAALDGTVQGVSGTTPFIRYGDGPAIGLWLSALLVALLLSRWGRGGMHAEKSSR
jgi:apolipoprotein N-acyltransferase